MEIRRSALVPQPRPEARLRVLCFHHATGSGLSFLPLVRSLPDEAEAVLVELPGRGAHSRRPFLPTFGAIHHQLLDDVAALIDRPVVLLGHSLGGMIADDLACRLPGSERRRVRRVVVSACAAPSTSAAAVTHPAAPLGRRTRAAIVAELRALGGTPSQIFDDDTLTQYAVELYERDMHLVDTFVPATRPDDAVPYEIWLGRDDVSVPLREADRWSADLGCNARARSFPGGHFYLFEPAPVAAFAELVTQEIDALSPERTGADSW